MGVISFRVSDETEKKLREKANMKKQSLTNFCKERISNDSEHETLNYLTVENRIEKLEKQQDELSRNLLFQSRFLYQFAILAANPDQARKAWDATTKELKEILGE